MTWTVVDTERDNSREFEARADAEAAAKDMRQAFGADVEVRPPEDSTTDGGKTVEPAVVETDKGAALPDRSVADDPIDWMPGEFIDTIDGSPAINRKGFEVLSHFYDVSIDPTLQVAPEETGHEYCRVRATATTAEGREVAAFGSAHVDRGDDPTLLVELAGTRARKRAISIATGAGAVAVAELKNEVER